MGKIKFVFCLFLATLFGGCNQNIETDDISVNEYSTVDVELSNAVKSVEEFGKLIHGTKKLLNPKQRLILC